MSSDNPFAEDWVMRESESGIRFSLAQLFALVAIICLLLAVLSPCLLSARTRSRANICRSNLRNLALTAVQYDNRRGFFPGRYEYAESLDGALSWRPMIYNVAPYLERPDIAEAYSRDNPNYANRNANNIPGVYLSMMVCPSDPQPGLVGNLAPTSYVFNGGVPDGHYPAAGPAPWTTTVMNDGVVAYNRVPSAASPGYNWNTSSRHISQHDGLTATLLLSENLDAGYWNSADERQLCFTWDNYDAPLQTLHRINASNRGQSPQQVADSYVYSKPTSNHGNVVLAAYCDGHVAFMNENIAYHVYVALCTPWGEQCHPQGNPQHVRGRTYLLDEDDY